MCTSRSVEEMSPERPPSQDGGPMLESPSLIMSSMPIESSHVILQQHIQYSNQGIGGGGGGGGGGDGGGGGGGGIVINGNGVATGSGGGSRNVNGQGPVAVEQTGSSKLLVLQQTSENYIAATNENNGVGNIVLLATEQMDVNPGDHNGIVTSANGADEELTPLTWLHNKDLLKGINLSCAKVQSSSDTLIKQNTGAISPTSDFLEDSCISEDNTSSIVSNSDQSIGMYSTETSPKLYISPNNNNNTINKNRNHLSTSTRTSTIQVSPGGTTTVIEYHSSGKQQQQQQNGVVGGGNVASSSNGGASTSTITTTTTTTSTPHQHFHKKYLREEHVKTLRQNQNDSGFVSPTTVGQQYEASQQQAVTPPQPVSPLRHRGGSGGGGGGGSGHHSQKSSSLNTTPSKLKHPTNQPYDPQVHTTNKPPFSFSSLIFMAIEDASEKALPVKEIYAWIVKHFPYFKTAPTGWKNSVRHNLSLNKCFQKVEKAPNMGKGSLWRVEQQYRQNLIQALTRSPFHPFSTFDKTVYKTQQGSNDSSTVSKSSSGRPLNASLTPRLSKFMAELDTPPEPPASPPIEDEYRHLTSYSYYENGTNAMLNVLVNSSENGGSATSSNSASPEKIARDWGADSSIEDVNAATAMLALKHGPKVFAETFQNGRPVITSSPSEDHTYSAGGNNNGTSTGIGNLSVNSSNSNSLDNTSNGTSSDAAYESSEESQMTSRAQEDLEEQRRKAEGVDALLNLAGVSLPPTAPIMLKRSSVDNQYHYHTSSTDAETPLSSPSPSKRSKQRPIRSKLKKKAAWLR
ncbi:uncharacterized protein DDB_G0280205 isoform X3 [Phlebotomus papatasi]|uniref:uncharacterized protein DDB_G0280205 isoform X3 n=1 Tax=Phlebotomus papatasi TaxID=29031 RepID=UPI0024841150|nr:uncharacterized protein DDB_G0280205 isoform X3 [Phlebotomus papatasi]